MSPTSILTLAFPLPPFSMRTGIQNKNRHARTITNIFDAESIPQ